MLPCPACQGPLVDFEPEPDAHVRLCTSCRGLLVAPATLTHLTGAQELDSLSERRGELGGFGRCPACGTRSWSCRRIRGSNQAGIGVCSCCESVWLMAGEFSKLQQQARAARRLTTAGSATTGATATASAAAAFVVEPITGPTDAAEPPELVAQSATGPSSELIGRIPFDRGIGNVLGVPSMLALGLVFCSGDLGNFLAALIGMPFHELGHALTSWLGSRIAVPLPFFTIWLQEQSLWFGLLVASVLGWFGFHSWREKHPFGVGVAIALLSLQVLVSWLMPTRLSEMIQILGGGLGEIVLGALLLTAFHFPLPDRLRWDFWRWPLLIPAGICFVRAFLMWSRAVDDPSHIPWGSAVGSASDGDMNRLVRDFGWTARGLTRFYLTSAWVALLAIVASYGHAWIRYRRAAPTAPHERRRAEPT